MQERPANNFGIAFILATLIAIGTGILILALGKTGSFQLINSNHHEIADQVFKYFTHYGDGLMWARDPTCSQIVIDFPNTFRIISLETL